MSQLLILASQSGYKKNLLERLQIEFKCISPEIDEKQQTNETPVAMAMRLAENKALAVAKIQPNALVIGSDQVGELEGKPLGKPLNFDQAVTQLNAQSTKKVYFHSAISVIKTLNNGDIIKKSKVNTTEVVFRSLSTAQIERYLKAETPYDCAGSFKSEGLGISLFSSVKSNDPTSLIGLPLIDLCTIFEYFQVSLPNKKYSI